MSKSCLKSGVTMLFSEFYRSKKLQKLNKSFVFVFSVFVYILGFIFYGVFHAKTDLLNKYMI